MELRIEIGKCLNAHKENRQISKIKETTTKKPLGKERVSNNEYMEKSIDFPIPEIKMFLLRRMKTAKCKGKGMTSQGKGGLKSTCGFSGESRG